MNCRRCGRVLKNPKHIEIGMGPVCARKNAMAVTTPGRVKNHVYDDFGGTEDIVAERLPDGRVKTNVVQVIERHSPDGFNFGYGGSGPADFALNILFKFGCSRDECEVMHQDFKWKFVSTLPQETGGRIKAEYIRGFINEHRRQRKPEADI